MPDQSAFNALSDPPNKTATLFQGLNTGDVSKTGKSAERMMRLTFGPMYPRPIFEERSLMLRGQHMKPK